MTNKYIQPVLSEDGITQYMGTAKKLVSEPKRNIVICNQVEELKHHNIFILTIFRAHVLELYRLLSSDFIIDAPELNNDEIEFIMGGSSLNDIERAKQGKIIISTYKYTGTGVSIDNMTAYR